MSKRSASEEKKPIPKIKVVESTHVGPADLKTNMAYSIKIICHRCSRLTELFLDASEIPEWALNFLFTVRWDPPDEPFSELFRTPDSEKDKGAIKRALELQALCEPEQWSSHKPGKHKPNNCVRDNVLDKLRKTVPDAKRGFLYNLDKQRNSSSLGKTITQYGNLLSGKVHFVTANTAISFGQIAILENWRDDI